MTNQLNSNRKPKVVIVITRSDIGGAQNHVLSLIKSFHKHYEMALVVGSKGFLADSVSAMGIKVHFLFDLDSYNPIKAIWKLQKILTQESPDLVHTHSSLASFYGRAAAKFNGIKVLYTVHGWHFAGEKNPIKWLIKVGLEFGARSFTDRWIAVSEFDLNLGRRFHLFKKNKIDVVVNGIENKPPAVRASVAIDAGQALEVVFVGRSTYQKNCTAALAVMEGTTENVNLTMFAAGGQISELVSAHAKSPVKSRIRLILNEPNAALEMDKFSVMLITSRYEGMPLGGIEGMRSGLAIVSTDVCGMNELVESGKNGYLFRQGDNDAMAGKLNELSQDRVKLAKMSNASRRRFERLYTLEKMLESTESVYKQLLRRD